MKAFGTRYEKALGKAFGNSIRQGIWFQFEDLDGQAYCQPDFLYRGCSQEQVVVLEVKYTWTESARAELEKLYLPVVGLALQAPAVGIVVCQKLVPGMKEKIVGDWGEALEAALKGRRVVWQWLPKTPIHALHQED